MTPSPMQICIIRNSISSSRTTLADVVWHTVISQSDSLLCDEQMTCEWRWWRDKPTEACGASCELKSFMFDPVPAGLLLLLPIHMAKTPTSMCMPLRTLNDSLSHRRRYMVRELPKVHRMLQWTVFWHFKIVQQLMQTYNNHWLLWHYKSNKNLHFKLYYVLDIIWKNFTSSLDINFYWSPREIL